MQKLLPLFQANAIDMEYDVCSGGSSQFYQSYNSKVFTIFVFSSCLKISFGSEPSFLDVGCVNDEADLLAKVPLMWV